MNAPIRELPLPARPADIGAEEWALRLELAACYRIFDMLGWTEMIFNHITLRLPGPERHFLINPYGLWYREVTASNLVKIDIDGKTIGASDWPVNPAGFVIHSAIHAPRRRALHHAHAHDGRVGDCRPARRAAPGQFLFGVPARPRRLSRFRGRHDARRREAAAGAPSAARTT